MLLYLITVEEKTVAGGLGGRLRRYVQTYPPRTKSCTAEGTQWNTKQLQVCYSLTVTIESIDYR